MKLHSSIPPIYKKPGTKQGLGILLSLSAMTSAILLTGISGWFISATALTGAGILGLAGYNLFLPSAAIRFLALGRPLARYYERLYSHQITFKQVGASRSWFFRKLFLMDKSRLIRFRNTDLPARITGDINQMDQFFISMALPWLTSLLLYIGAAIYFSFINPMISLLLVIIFGLCGMLLPFIALKQGMKRERERIMMQQLSAQTGDHLAGYRELKAFGLIASHAQQIQNQFEQLSELRKKALEQKGRLFYLQHIALQTGLAAALIILYHWNLAPKTAGGQPNGPMMVLTMFVLIALFELLLPLTDLLFQHADTIRAGQNLQSLNEEPARADHQVRITAGNNLNESKTVNIRPLGISLSALTFRFGNRLLYNHTDLSFPANTTSIIRGDNGCGKSTLLDLIAGLQQPESGMIRVNHIPLSSLDEEERIDSIAYMEQQPVLFNTTIYGNIEIGNAEATADAIRNAAGKAGLNSFISSLPLGIHTRVGEGGTQVSGGQARLICLARLILKDAPILLLDEPTEGFDTAATQNFSNLMESWKGRKTIIMITHKDHPALQPDFCYRLAHHQLVAEPD